jgi:hypothetical protein
MGGQRAAVVAAPEVFEPADPARTMPKWLVFGAIAAVIIVVLAMSWLNERSLSDSDAEENAVAAASVARPAATPAPAPQPAPTAQGPVVLTATGPAWIQVTDGGKTLFSGELQTNQTFAVPATATAPLLKAGKPENLQITVGSAVAPPVGPPGRVASKVSLLGPDLMKGGAAAPATPSGVPAPAAPPATNAATE